MRRVHCNDDRTTAAVRRAIQSSSESAGALAARYGITRKTVQKWRSRTYAHDAPRQPPARFSTTLSRTEETIVILFRRYTLLPLDDCLYALQGTIPELTRSSLYRCLKRYGINKLPASEADAKVRLRIKACPIGHFYVDVRKVGTREGPLYHYLATDRTTKLIYLQVSRSADQKSAYAFLKALIEVLPYRVASVLTRNEVQFAPAPQKGRAAERRNSPGLFGVLCAHHGIEHFITTPESAWTDQQLALMERAGNLATTNVDYYTRQQDLLDQSRSFSLDYNFERRLKSLKGLTPYGFICKMWKSHPHLFERDPRDAYTETEIQFCSIDVILESAAHHPSL